MNQSQIQQFLKCVSQIEDNNFLTSHTKDNHDHMRHDDHDHDHDHDHDDDDYANKIIVAKAVTMVVLFCASTLCGSIPFLLNRCFKWTERQDSARSAWIVQCLLYFGGGVLLATTFLHLLPEVQETVEQMTDCNVLPALSFPLAELLMCTGFFLMYFIEEAIHLYIRNHRKNLGLNHGAGAAFERGHSIRNSFLIKGKRPAAEQNECQQADGIESGTVKKTETSTAYDQENKQSCSDTKNHAGHGHSHMHLPNEADGKLTSSLRGLFVVLALSLHELFEGMAIGLETSSATAVWFMFGAVSAHKLVLAFCVGVELIVARTRLFLAIIYVITFAIVSPIGIGIGILLSSGSSGAAPSIPSAILQGMACGTLLYVVFFEILSKDNSGIKTYISLVFGFVLMFGLQQIGAGGHGHSHGGCGSHSHDHENEDVRSHHDHTEHDDLERKHKNLEQQLQILRQASKTIYESMKSK